MNDPSSIGRIHARPRADGPRGRHVVAAFGACNPPRGENKASMWGTYGHGSSLGRTGQLDQVLRRHAARDRHHLGPVGGDAVHLTRDGFSTAAPRAAAASSAAALAHYKRVSSRT